MPRKSIDNERHSQANCRRWPRRAIFALWGCLWEFEGAEARCQSNRGIKSGGFHINNPNILFFDIIVNTPFIIPFWIDG
ncbi:hypothetical protein BFP46_24745 [Bacillus licheniformis]|nr:hypothetical protein BFP47_23405 [Bacillus licheniformis]OJT66473.1 hypothetical protein BFP46_24745 [Bacillus licheniformis]